MNDSDKGRSSYGNIWRVQEEDVSFQVINQQFGNVKVLIVQGRQVGRQKIPFYYNINQGIIVVAVFKSRSASMSLRPNFILNPPKLQQKNKTKIAFTAIGLNIKLLLHGEELAFVAAFRWRGKATNSQVAIQKGPKYGELPNNLAFAEQKNGSLSTYLGSYLK